MFMREKEEAVRMLTAIVPRFQVECASLAGPSRLSYVVFAASYLLGCG